MGILLLRFSRVGAIQKDSGETIGCFQWLEDAESVTNLLADGPPVTIVGNSWAAG